MQKKHEKEDIDPFKGFLENQYYEIIEENIVFYYHLKTKQKKCDFPPIGSWIRRIDGTSWYEVRPQQPPPLDPQLTAKKFGPVGSNLFLFHLPNDVHELEIYNIFQKYGNILSVRIMKQKNGKSRGIGFVSFDSPASAKNAIQEMNGFEIRGKRLKVQLNKKDQEVLGKTPSRLQFSSIF